MEPNGNASADKVAIVTAAGGGMGAPALENSRDGATRWR